MIYTASVACANPLRLEEDVALLMEGGIRTLHLDLMDGHHVPSLCLNVDTIAQLHARFPKALLDAHLMVENPLDYFTPLAEAGVHWLTLVPSTAEDPAAALAGIRRLGMKAGFVINLNDTVEQFAHLLPMADLVVLMSIPSGGYGRPFQEETYERIRSLAALREEKGYDYLISVDGGITRENSLLCRDCGADVLVEGVFTLFRQPLGIKQACRSYIQWMEEH